MWPMSFLLLPVLAVLIGKGSRKNAAPCIQSTCFPPARMENHVFFPNRILCRLNSLMTGKEDIPDEALLEKLTEAYQRAWEKGDCRMCGTSLVFDTDLQTKDGKFLRGMLIPDPNDPAPNTWRLSELECVEK